MRWFLTIAVWISCGVAQQATNGQQIAFGGIRFQNIDIQGNNQNNITTTWRSDFPAEGRTLVFVDRWWWKGAVSIRAKLMNGQQFECKTAPLGHGSYFVMVIAQSNGSCISDPSNSQGLATAIEKWAIRNHSNKQRLALRKLMDFARDGWSCVGALAQDTPNKSVQCSGVPEEIYGALR